MLKTCVTTNWYHTVVYMCVYVAHHVSVCNNVSVCSTSCTYKCTYSCGLCQHTPSPSPHPSLSLFLSAYTCCVNLPLLFITPLPLSVSMVPLDGEQSLSDVKNMIYKLYTSLNVDWHQVWVCVSSRSLTPLTLLSYSPSVLLSHIS